MYNSFGKHDEPMDGYWTDILTYRDVLMFLQVSTALGMELKSPVQNTVTTTETVQPILRGASHVQQDIFASVKALPATKTILVLQDHFALKQPEKLYHAPLEHTENILVQLLRMTAVCVLLDITALTKMEPLPRFSALRVISALRGLRTKPYVPLAFTAIEQKPFIHAILVITVLLVLHIRFYVKRGTIAQQEMKMTNAQVH